MDARHQEPPAAFTSPAAPLPRLVRVEDVHRGWARYSIATFDLPDGVRFAREIEDHGAAVAVMAFDPVRRTVFLVRQFRAAAFLAAGTEEIAETCAGGLEADEAPADCARRELLEECGLEALTLDPVAIVWSMPGVSTERIHYFIAEVNGAVRGPGGGLAEEQEGITVEEIALDVLVADRFVLMPDLKSQFLLDRLLDKIGRAPAG